MVYRGHVQNGVVVIEGDQKPPEGLEVRIEPWSTSDEPSKPSDLRDFLLSIAGKAEGLPADYAANHDHYLYGTPRKQ